MPGNDYSGDPFGRGKQIIVPQGVITLFYLSAYESKFATPPNKKAFPEIIRKGFVPRTGFPT